VFFCGGGGRLFLEKGGKLNAEGGCVLEREEQRHDEWKDSRGRRH